MGCKPSLGHRGTDCVNDTVGYVEHRQRRHVWKNLDWTDGARTGLIFMTLGAYFLYRDVDQPDFLDSGVDWAIAIGLSFGGWIILQFARMLSCWNWLRIAISTDLSKRTGKQWRTLRRGYRELFLYLAMGLALLAFLAWSLRTNSFVLWPELTIPLDSKRAAISVQSIVILSGLALSFVPASVGNWLRANHEARSTKYGLFRSDAVSSTSAYVGGALLVLIIWLAVWAGNQTSQISSSLAFYVTFAVMLMFIVFILWPHAARLLNSVFERREINSSDAAAAGVPASLPATTLSYADSFLVRLVAPLSGATQRGPLVPHTFVVLVLAPLIALGFFLPSPYGLFPVFLGMLIVLALGRRWAWIEDDRETASRLLQTESDEIHIGFDNDLKDEALLGYTSLFLFVPLALYQIHGWLPGVFVPGDGYVNDPVRDWVGFFGSELAKAVPFVDWWEIYQIDIDRPYQPAAELPLGKHLTFVARAMVDLVIMAALFQALSIWQRGRTQNRLYDAGQLDAFDPFTEYEFFTRGMLKTRKGYIPRKRFETRIDDHLASRSALGLPPTPYNERRLSDIIGNGSDDPKLVEVVAGAKWMIKTFNVLAGAPEQKLSQLLRQWRMVLDEADLTHYDFSSSVFEDWRRNEKLRLEALLSEVRDTKNEIIPKRLQQRDIQNLVCLAKLCDSAVEFQFARVLILEILGETPHESAFWGLAAQVGGNGFYITQTDYEQHMRGALGEVVLDNFERFSPPRLRQQEMRVLAFAALEAHSHFYECEDARLKYIAAYLEKVAASETKDSSKRARSAARNIHRGCKGLW